MKIGLNKNFNKGLNKGINNGIKSALLKTLVIGLTAVTTLVMAVGLTGCNKGDTGKTGKSAYELYCDEHSGTDLTLTEWLASLKGKDGNALVEIGENYNWFINGEDTGVLARSVNGKSAYEVYCEENQGPSMLTQTEWLASLKGRQGIDSVGKSTYDLYYETFRLLNPVGDPLSVLQWLESLKGKNAYEVWLKDNGFSSDDAADNYRSVDDFLSAYFVNLESGVLLRLNALEDENGEISGRLDALEDESGDASDRLDTLEDENKDLSDRLEALERENRILMYLLEHKGDSSVLWGNDQPDGDALNASETGDLFVDKATGDIYKKCLAVSDEPEAPETYEWIKVN
jgi:hypothetical protein